MIGIAFWSYIAQLAPARAIKLFLGIAALLIIGAYAGHSSGLIPRAFFENLHGSLIVLGIPLFATLLSEISLRDGISNRTLLYPLLGPVSRSTVATVRTLTTGLLLFLGTSALVTIVRLICEVPWATYPRELCAILLGSLVYVAIAGFVHLLTTKGLITSLAIFSILDHPIGRLPFSLRNIAPSYHTRILADQTDTFALPISVGISHTPFIGSLIYLIVLTTIAIVATAFVFKRKNLGKLC